MAPDLNNPPRFYKPNPHFAQGELLRIVREIMWETGGPLSVRTISLAALARKGVTLPGPGTMKRTRTRIQQIFVASGKQGKVRTVGRKKDRRQVLVRATTDAAPF